MAYGSNMCPLNIGEISTRDFPDDVKGGRYEVNNMQDAPTDGTQTDGRKTIVVLAKNSSSATILKRQGITWKSTGHGWEIGAESGAGARVDGFVDPHLSSAGVLDTQWCLVVVEGPTILEHDGTTSVSIADEVIAVASGQVNKVSADPPAVADIEAMAGIAEAAVNTAGAGFNARVALRG